MVSSQNKYFITFLVLFILNINFVFNKLFLFPFEKIDTVDPSADPQQILLQLTNNSCRVEMKIGTPPQTLYLHASTDRGYTYVIGEDATIYEDELKYKLFKHSKSSTYKAGEDGMVFDSDLIVGNYMTDNFHFGDIVAGDISILEGYEFYLGFDLPCDSGIFGVGMSVLSPLRAEKSSIERQLKEKDLIDNHYMFVHYTSEGKGVIGIGGEHKEVAKKYKNEIIHFIKMASFGSDILLGFDFENITYNGEPIYIDSKKAQISIDFAVIQADLKLKEILDRSFFDLLLQNETCKMETMRYEYKDTYYYHCQKGMFDKNKLYTLRLKNKDWNTTFEINFRELWKSYGGRDYFLVYFYAVKTNPYLVLGEPFLKKYTFTFDLSNKLVGYYDGLNEGADTEKKGFDPTVLVVVLVSIAIICVLLFFLYRLWRRQPRKLRGTELEDTYEYVGSR